MLITCTHCRSQANYPDMAPGRLIPCEKCGRYFLTPDPSLPAPTSQPPPSGRIPVRQQPTAQDANSAGTARMTAVQQAAAMPNPSGAMKNALGDVYQQLAELRQLQIGMRNEYQAVAESFRRDQEKFKQLIEKRPAAAPAAAERQAQMEKQIERLEDSVHEVQERVEAEHEQQGELLKMIRDVKESRPRNVDAATGLTELRSLLQAGLQKSESGVASLREQFQQLRQAVGANPGAHVSSGSSPDLAELGEQCMTLRRRMESQAQQLLDMVQSVQVLEQRCTRIEEETDGILNKLESKPAEPRTAVFKAPGKTPPPVPAPVLPQATVPVTVAKVQPLPQPALSLHDALKPSVSNWLDQLAPMKDQSPSAQGQYAELEQMHSQISNLRHDLEEKDRLIEKTLGKSLPNGTAAEPAQAGLRESEQLRHLGQLEKERDDLNERIRHLEALFIELSEDMLQAKLESQGSESGSTPDNWRHGIHFELLTDDPRKGN